MAKLLILGHFRGVERRVDTGDLRTYGASRLADSVERTCRSPKTCRSPQCRHPSADGCGWFRAPFHRMPL